jgi:hypothetical protein
MGNAESGYPARALRRIWGYLGQDFGLLRSLLGFLALALAVAMPPPNTPMVLDGPAVLTTLVVPVAAPVVLFVLALDMLMGWIFALEQHAAIRRRYRHIRWMELVLFVVLFLRWLPLVLALAA